MGIISREIIGYIIVLQIKRHVHETRSHARLWSNGLQWHNQPRPMSPDTLVWAFYPGLCISSAYGGPQRLVSLGSFVLSCFYNKMTVAICVSYDPLTDSFLCSGAIHNLLPQCK